MPGECDSYVLHGWDYAEPWLKTQLGDEQDNVFEFFERLEDDPYANRDAVMMFDGK